MKQQKYTHIMFKIHKNHFMIDQYLKSNKQPWVSNFYEFRRFVEMFYFIDIMFLNNDELIKKHEMISFQELKSIVSNDLYNVIKFYPKYQDETFIKLSIDEKYKPFDINDDIEYYHDYELISQFSRKSFIDYFYKHIEKFDTNNVTNAEQFAILFVIRLLKYENLMQFKQFLIRFRKDADYKIVENIYHYIIDNDLFYIRSDVMKYEFKRVRDKIYNLIIERFEVFLIVCLRQGKKIASILQKD